MIDDVLILENLEVHRDAFMFYEWVPHYPVRANQACAVIRLDENGDLHRVWRDAQDLLGKVVAWSTGWALPEYEDNEKVERDAANVEIFYLTDWNDTAHPGKEVLLDVFDAAIEIAKEKCGQLATASA